MQINTTIETLILKAKEEGLVIYNRYGVGSFFISLDILPATITFDRLKLCDVLITNGCAQIRKRKGNKASIVFSYYEEEETTYPLGYMQGKGASY